jgi:hypothetical protein
LRFFELMGREALISASPPGSAAALAFSFCFPFAFADILFDPLISLAKKLGGGVATAAAGGGFAAGMGTAPLRSEIFAPTTKRRRQEISREMRQQKKGAHQGSWIAHQQRKAARFYRGPHGSDREFYDPVIKSGSRSRTEREERMGHVPPAPCLQSYR